MAQVAPTGEGFIGYADAGCCRCSRRSGSSACSGTCSTRTSSLARSASGRCRSYHQDHPFTFHLEGQHYNVSYLPAESDTGMFGGNSNWRGPIWMPVNALIVRGLLNLYASTATTSRSSALPDRGTG